MRSARIRYLLEIIKIETAMFVDSGPVSLFLVAFLYYIN
jgi:hypothetical protein